MEESNTADDFRDWLGSNTALSETSIKQYFYVIRSLLGRYKNPTIDQLNNYVVMAGRRKRSGLVDRIAIINYLKFLKRESEIPLLAKVQDKGRTKLDKRPTIEHMAQLMPHFKDELTKDVFTIQSNSGCRQVEAWYIDIKDRLRYEEGVAIILTVQKGGRTRPLYILEEVARSVFDKPAYKGKRFPFLPDDAQNTDRDTFLRKHYERLKMRYWRAWERACKAAGLPKFASHDARRAIIRAVWKRHGPLAAKKVSGHTRFDTTASYADENDNPHAALSDVTSIMRRG